jgi:sterol desaturase/sphingolipid hydroxylase (fatty acid hydroxylase superfamily)
MDAIATTRTESGTRGAWMMRAAYPLLWIWLIACSAAALHAPAQLATIAAVKGFVIFALLFALELAYPLERRWGITWKLFLRRDAVLAAVNMGATALLSYALLILAIGAAEDQHGIMSGRPLWIQVVIGLVVFELLQYSVHRSMHLSKGPITDFLWRTHAVHHLPQQLYLVMHIVFHPLNLVIVRVAVQLTPIWVLGFDPMAVFLYGSVIGLHGTISHLNFDLRMGWMNYLFVGPELHRYHHSAASHEAQNYGAALSLLDQLFGTFHYTPGTHPEALGLSEAHGYPGQTQPLKALIFPFTSRSVR